MSAAAGQTPDIGFVTMRDVPINTGPLKFPEEVVFVPSFDEEPFRPPPLAPLPVRSVPFEDGEADDEFERSLGGLRLEEIEEAVNVEEIKAVQPEAPEPVISPTKALEPSVQDPREAIAIVDRSDVSDVPLVPVDSTENKSISLRRTAFLILWTTLFGIAAFASGIGATMWFFDLPPAVPSTVEVPVVYPDSQVPTPPTDMAYVPGGEFQMGSDDGDAFSKPAHTVSIGPFFIDVTEVTNEAYYEFVKASDHATPPTWTNGSFPTGQEKYPVTGVSWYDALEFAAWNGKRLPTEAEWEFAARGSDSRMYPWGDIWSPDSANVSSKNGIRAVGSGIASPFGLYDMAGNVWEWTASDAKSYASRKRIPWSRLRLKVIRGGNWLSDSRTASSTFRGFYGATGEKEYNSTGFRCAKDLPKN